ncbi:hypothetical protein [Halorubrum lipolyticum]|uniref:Uncharacterized protein n=1 Tax=Halorubrum lipolyticum DSM 21995 TaxID=1227482 RepID=M0NMZ5_9EURY|nr:hypothetical protein [Halorubrum lipolyticum]EMA59181.1 hypothetical protein C469_11141 [Halorubrum lipolyticum DSM 21995]
MPDRPSSGGREAEHSAEADDVSVDGATAEVDDEVQRRLRAAYLNDAERDLIVTGVRSAGSEVVVEFRTPHGDATHTERFPAPRHGSLSESAAFVAFLEAAGVSPLDVEELVGTRVSATYDGDEWRLDESYLPDSSEDATNGDAEGDPRRSRSTLKRSREWLWTYRYWLFAAVLIGGELLFVALVIALFG